MYGNRFQGYQTKEDKIRGGWVGLNLLLQVPSPKIQYLKVLAQTPASGVNSRLGLFIEIWMPTGGEVKTREYL